MRMFLLVLAALAVPILTAADAIIDLTNPAIWWIVFAVAVTACVWRITRPATKADND